MNRQQIRNFTLIIALLLFPITMWYFSPYLIIDGALKGIISGSFIVFCLFFICSIFFGRIFCGWFCPTGCLQECLIHVNSKSPKQKWQNYIKYVIWFFWITAIILCFVFQDNSITVDFLYMTDHGISISHIYCYIIYYGVLLLVIIPGVLFGKRAFCHYFCWMAPFMGIGIKLRKLLHLPGLYIEATPDKCISCKKCDKSCPMSLSVSSMVANGGCSSAECIQCGKCIDQCPNHVLKFKMGDLKNDKREKN